MRTHGRDEPLLRWEPWYGAAIVAVAAGVLFSVLLISVSYGVHQEIAHRLASPELRHVHGVNVAIIDEILKILTIVITAAVLTETAVATFVLGTTVMHSRREEVAIRRQSGVLRSTLLLEFLRTILLVALLGGCIGEALGVGLAVLLSRITVLPVQFTEVSLLAAFPVAVALSVLATLLPAYRSASVSPALLRKG